MAKAFAAIALIFLVACSRTAQEQACHDKAELAYHRILSQKNDDNSPGIGLMAGRTYSITYRSCMRNP